MRKGLVSNYMSTSSQLVDCLINGFLMGSQHEKLYKYMSTYSTNPKPTLLRVSRHVDTNLLIVSRISKVDYRNKN